MSYSKVDIENMFKSEVESFLPGRFSDSLVRKTITNSNGNVIVKNKVREIFNMIDLKDRIEANVKSEVYFPLEQYISQPTPQNGALIYKYLIISNGRFTADFYVGANAGMVSLVLDLIYYGMNGMGSEVYSLMNMLSTEVKNYEECFRYDYVELSTSNKLIKIKAMEL